MWILKFGVILTLFALIASQEIANKNETSSSLLEEGGHNDAPAEESIIENDEDPSVEQPADDGSELPILPPIILLDFADDNSTSSEENSKRTIDNNLGYGYLRNNLLNGKFNYYFPGGKSGTTVSIEESISPFEPKTIIERVKPITEKSPSNTPAYQTNRYEQTTPRYNNYNIDNYQSFGQRTKLQKYSPPDPYSQSVSSTPTPNEHATSTSNYRNIQNSYNTFLSGHQNAYNKYASPQTNQEFQTSTTAPVTYERQQNYYQNQRQRPIGDGSDTTERPFPTDPTAFNLPKYTVENGVRYENKIVWKYPDGRVVDAPPTSYMNSYSEYADQAQQNIASSYQRNRQPVNYSPEALPLRGIANANRYSQHTSNGQYQVSEIQSNTQDVYRQPSRIQNTNIYDQRPAQFPNDQDSRYQTTNPTNYNAGISTQAQGYDFSYQQKYGLRQRNPQTTYGQVPKYVVDSSNPEQTPSTINESSFTPDGQLTMKALSKYSPEAQKYLKKIFNQRNNMATQQQQKYAHQLNQYTNTNYENLLNYNPSISEYIRDPSSILNAQPTFIQAGDSLIPVIILRVGGAPPVQRKPSPSINLKALLQQYLSQYAESKAALSVPSTYRYEENINQTPSPVHQSAVNDLTKLTHVLSRYSQSQNIQQPPTSIQQKLADHPLDTNSNPVYYGKNSYDTIKETVDQRRDQFKVKYGTRIGAKQKVKNVQILGNA